MAIDPQTTVRTESSAAAQPTSPLRIAICLSHFYPTVGGAERQLLQLARRWDAAGHGVHVFTRTLAGQPRLETVQGVVIHRSIRTWERGPLFGVSYILSLLAALVRYRRSYDVVLAGQASWEAVAASLASSCTGRPFLVRAASTGPDGDLAQLTAAKGGRLWIRLLRRARRMLASSSPARDEFLAAGCAPDRVRLLRNGVDLRQFAPPNDRATEPPAALFVGRLVDVKRPLILLEAWREANAAGEYRLLVVGDGPLRARLEAYAEQHGLRGVEFAGEQADVAPWYARADVFVLASAAEGSSNALLEAMSSGLCPVVTQVGGNVDLVRDHINGLLAPPDDAPALAAALRLALGDRPLRERLGGEARRTIEREHDLDQTAAAYLSLFAQAVSARGG